MKNLKEISKILQDYERRISVLESSTGKIKKSVLKSSKKYLTDYIIELRDAHFFSQPKTVVETHVKLSVKYPCELNRVAVALVRLGDRKQLRKVSKTINNKKYKAYVW